MAANVLFFLRPKIKVAYVYSHNTLRQALEKMKAHGYTSIPVLDNEGRYVGSVTEGDFLWKLTAEHALNSKAQERFCIKDIMRSDFQPPVNINAALDDLLLMAMNQNFVPVVDDLDSFIGIVTRRDLMQHYYNQAHDENYKPEPFTLQGGGTKAQPI